MDEDEGESYEVPVRPQESNDDDGEDYEEPQENYEIPREEQRKDSDESEGENYEDVQEDYEIPVDNTEKGTTKYDRDSEPFPETPRVSYCCFCIPRKQPPLNEDNTYEETDQDLAKNHELEAVTLQPIASEQFRPAENTEADYGPAGPTLAENDDDVAEFYGEEETQTTQVNNNSNANSNSNSHDRAVVPEDSDVEDYEEPVDPAVTSNQLIKAPENPPEVPHRSAHHKEDPPVPERPSRPESETTPSNQIPPEVELTASSSTLDTVVLNKPPAKKTEPQASQETSLECERFIINAITPGKCKRCSRDRSAHGTRSRSDTTPGQLKTNRERSSSYVNVEDIPRDRSNTSYENMNHSAVSGPNDKSAEPCVRYVVNALAFGQCKKCGFSKKEHTPSASTSPVPAQNPLVVVQPEEEEEDPYQKMSHIGIGVNQGSGKYGRRVDTPEEEEEEDDIYRRKGDAPKRNPPAIPKVSLYDAEQSRTESSSDDPYQNEKPSDDPYQNDKSSGKAEIGTEEQVETISEDIGTYAEVHDSTEGKNEQFESGYAPMHEPLSKTSESKDVDMDAYEDVQFAKDSEMHAKQKGAYEGFDSFMSPPQANEEQDADDGDENNGHEEAAIKKRPSSTSFKVPGTSMSERPVHTWRSRDKCYAVYSGDGLLYQAVIVMVEYARRQAYINFEGYDEKEEVSFDDIYTIEEVEDDYHPESDM
eukprot:m.159736 g.159736  ORF g.159736 m.159736 type:complete len:705 (-) comp15158_c0_seq1:107-2221(-)